MEAAKKGKYRKILESIGYQQDNNIVYCTDQISSSISSRLLGLGLLGLLGLGLTLIALT